MRRTTTSAHSEGGREGGREEGREGRRKGGSCLVVEHQLFLPSQVILNKGDIGHYLYILTRGEAEGNA